MKADDFHIVRIVVVVLIGCVVFPSSVLAAEDSVQKFERFLNDARDATNSGTVVYFNKYHQAWTKRRHTVGDIKYDVKKTDSLVNPVLGFVTLSLVTEQTEFFPTKEEAANASAFIPAGKTLYRISLTYFYKENNKWLFSQGKYEMLLPAPPTGRGITSEVTEQEIQKDPTALPMSALMYWLPK